MLLVLTSFAPDAAAQCPAGRDAPPDPGPGEVGHVFRDLITVGDDHAVECTFKVIDGDAGSPRQVQIGNNRSVAISPDAKGKLHLPEQAIDRLGDGQAYTVTSVDESAFRDCASLTSSGLSTNGTVTSIGESAFNGCVLFTSTGLESNTKVRTLGKWAFQNCSSLTSTGLESNVAVTFLDVGTFYGCASLLATGLSSNATVISVCDWAFSHCTSLSATGLEMNNTVTSLGAHVFRNCTSLISTGLEENTKVTSLGESVFNHCSRLRSTGLETNAAVTSLGEWAFQDCISLKSTGLETNTAVTSLNRAAFQGCTALVSTGLASNSVLSFVGDNVFEGCISLTSTGLEGNNKLTLMRNGVFYGCTSLTSTGLDVNATVTSVGDWVFQGCTSLTSTGLTENRTVAKVGGYCFRDCPSLGAKPDATGQAETGDLVLGAPAGGGVLEVGAHAFEGTAFSRLYLRGHRDRFDMDAEALTGADRVGALYVPASWGGIGTCDIGGRTFSVAEGSLAVMDPELADVSASRTPLTSDEAAVTLSASAEMDIDVTAARGGALVSNAHIAPSGPGRSVRVGVPAGSGLDADANRLTVSAAGPVTYPAASGSRGYNSATCADVACDLAAVSYRVVFDADGGTGSMPAITLSHGAPATLPACSLTRASFDFSGWSTAADGSGLSIPDGGTVENLSDLEGATVTLYARWAPALTLEVRCRSQSAGGGRGDPLPGCGLALSTTSDASGEIFSVFTDPDRTSPVTGWPIDTDGSGELRLYGLSTGTCHLLVLKVPPGYQAASPDAASLTVEPDGTVSVDGSDPVEPAGGVISVGLSLAPLPVLPSAGKTSEAAGMPGAVAAAGVATALLAATYLAAGRAARG